jgi:Putative  PD-(D/E)XK family member, (DUF4420)
MDRLDLNELCRQITTPNETDGFQFSALTIPQYSNHRLAKDKNHNILLLIAFAKDTQTRIFGDYQLENLSINLDVRCNIQNEGLIYEKEFSIVCYKGKDISLKKYFLQLCEMLLIELGSLPTLKDVKSTLQSLIMLFRLAAQPPKKTVQGLWAELFIIANSKNPAVLVDAWHSFPEERYDFNNGVDRIEVKSTANNSRKHHFSLEQLNPPDNCRLIIASIFVLQSANGQSINALQKIIENRLNSDLTLINRLRLQIADTLGDAIVKGVEVEFDNQLAIESLRFYNFVDVPKIQAIDVPIFVSDVGFSSDVSDITTIIPALEFDTSELYLSL